MKSLFRSSCLAMVVVLIGASSGLADSLRSVNFFDTHNYWLQGEGGLPNGTGPHDWDANGVVHSGYDADHLDNIGTPNFGPFQSVGGTVTVNSQSRVKSISFNYTNNSAVEKPGDLFLDVNGDHFWDYVVKIYGTTGAGTAGTYNLIKMTGNGGLGMDMWKDGTDAGKYLMSGVSGQYNAQTGTNWAGYIIRDNHPFGIAPNAVGTVIDTVAFDGWKVAGGTSTFSFNLNDLPAFDGSHPLTLAWGPDCANDVVFEHVAIPPPVPEPSTLMLFGGGLLGLIGWRSRRNRTAPVSA